jgi:hypothetical protein
MIFLKTAGIAAIGVDRHGEPRKIARKAQIKRKLYPNEQPFYGPRQQRSWGKSRIFKRLHQAQIALREFLAPEEGKKTGGG